MFAISLLKMQTFFLKVYNPLILNKKMKFYTNLPVHIVNDIWYSNIFWCPPDKIRWGSDRIYGVWGYGRSSFAEAEISTCPPCQRRKIFGGSPLCRRRKILGGPPLHKFSTWKIKCLKTPWNEEKCDFRHFLEKFRKMCSKKKSSPPWPGMKKM